MQLTGSYAGKRLFAQGYSLPSGAVNLGYQRKFRPDLMGVITVSDIFASSRIASVTDTPTLFGFSTQRQQGRIVSLSLLRLFGGRPARDAQFDYEVAAP